MDYLAKFYNLLLFLRSLVTIEVLLRNKLSEKGLNDIVSAALRVHCLIIADCDSLFVFQGGGAWWCAGWTVSAVLFALSLIYRFICIKSVLYEDNSLVMHHLGEYFNEHFKQAEIFKRYFTHRIISI